LLTADKTLFLTMEKPRLNVSDRDGVIAKEDNVDEQVSNVITFQHSAILIFVIVGRNDGEDIYPAFLNRVLMHNFTTSGITLGLPSNSRL
jgi:hypothetical protein